MSPLAHVMSVDQDGGVGEEVTEDQIGSPERLYLEDCVSKDVNVAWV